MKLEKIKLKWKIFAYILIFASLIVAVFCFFQIFMLETFYKKNKISAIDSLVDRISNIVSEKSLDEDSTIKELTSISSESEIGIYLFNTTNGEELKLNFFGPNHDYFRSPNVVKEVIEKGKMLGTQKFFISFSTSIPAPVGVGNGPIVNSKVIDTSDSSIICGKFVKLKVGTSALLVLDARLTPVTPAVVTMKQQLFIITIIVILLSIVVALLISSIISKPIKKMNDTAKLLAKGRRDITFSGKGFSEITELNHTLNYAVAELNKTDTLQKELLANISHDLKTPLTLISGYAEMMKDIPEENTNENLQLIVDEANRLNVLVNDLLNLSRLQAKTETFNIETYNFTASVRSIVDREQKFFEKNNFVFTFEYDKEVKIKADEHKISQVIYNFINNAINYSGTSLNIEVKQKIEGEMVKLEVIDHGIGIKNDELDVIWNRYYRVDKGHKRSSQGSGLGLSIVKEILEYHNFTYGVTSKEGEGSCFWFVAPIEKN